MWMQCTTCKRVVLVNDTNICQSCQNGFDPHNATDQYMDFKINSLQKALEDAVQESQSTSVDVCQ